MFALGGAVLLGLFLSPRPRSPQVPPGVPWGVPEQGLTFVFFDAESGGQRTSTEAILADIRAHVPEPDYVLLLGVPGEQVLSLAAGLGMQGSFDPRLHRPTVPGTRGRNAAWVCILSKHPLYEAATVPAQEEGQHGVSAVSVVGGRKFWVACLHSPDEGASALLRAFLAWQRAGSPPAVLGGYYSPKHPAEIGRFDPSTGAGFSPTTAPVPGPDRLMSVTSDWAVRDSGAWGGTGSPGAGAWATLGPRQHGAAPATLPPSGGGQLPQEQLRR